MRDVSDEQLMQQYAAGNATAFEALYQRHRGPVYRYFMRQNTDAATANDLYQGVWEKIINARHRYRPDAKFTTWMYRIAHNHLMDHFRRQKPTVPEEKINSLESGDTEAGEVIDQGQQHDQLMRAIRGLPNDQRDTLMLKLEGGLSLEEIGNVTGVNRETVKSRLRYASNKLKLIVER